MIEWKMEQLKTLDRNTRTLVFENGSLHQKSNVIRSYSPRKGGERLISIEVCVSERKSLNWYLVNIEEKLLKYMAK